VLGTAETARADESAAPRPVSRLAELRAIRAERDFDPFQVIIEEIQRKGSGKGRLTAKEKVQAAEGLARLELDYEKFEFAKAHGGGPKTGGRVQVNPDGSVQVDMWSHLDEVSDEELEARARERARALGLVAE
jgi:hypothetical protein